MPKSKAGQKHVLLGLFSRVGDGDPNWCVCRLCVLVNSRKSGGNMYLERSSCQELGFGIYEIWSGNLLPILYQGNNLK